ncbi:hypothetical protein [Polyangium aurulentum]|uniref:hypothetical protein n=1 Tax=Polyangium aurulentum TaxID=2567896 RepID=UPI0010AE6EA8|nr:hypothetical protein [Polyangium aurulentum]UQA56622.1 hypothetical protein E8A73_035735 [Polyangium aurulentum]
MPRSFAAADVVTLPRVDARDAVALASAVEAAAAGQQGVPPYVLSAVAQIADDRQALQKAIAAGPPAGAITIKEADRVEDLAITSLYALLMAWGRLAEFLPEAKGAQEVVDRVFKDGVSFVNSKVEKEWAVIDSKLKAISDEGLDAKLAAVGALPILEFLKQTHATYGAVIGTTDAVAEPVEVGKLREALLDSLRVYVMRASGLVERNKPETQALADALLRPITEWRTSRSATKDKAEGSTAQPGTP